MKEHDLGKGHHVVGFDSADEMFQYMADQEEKAMLDTLPEQWQIKNGDRVFRQVEGGLSIWGQIFTWDEFLADNTPAGKKPDEEILQELEDLKNAHDRGYRYGRWFSEVEPDGEYGSAHVVSLWRISHSDFEIARRNEWQLYPALAYQIETEVQAARTREGRDQDEVRPEE